TRLWLEYPIHNRGPQSGVIRNRNEFALNDFIKRVASGVCKNPLVDAGYHVIEPIAMGPRDRLPFVSSVYEKSLLTPDELGLHATNNLPNLAKICGETFLSSTAQKPVPISVTHQAAQLTCSPHPDLSPLVDGQPLDGRSSRNANVFPALTVVL